MTDLKHALNCARDQIVWLKKMMVKYAGGENESTKKTLRIIDKALEKEVDDDHIGEHGADDWKREKENDK
jgi:hypothetical protein